MSLESRRECSSSPDGQSLYSELIAPCVASVTDPRHIRSDGERPSVYATFPAIT